MHINPSNKMVTLFKTTFLLFSLLMLLTGVIYPLFVTGVAQLFFPKQANGSLIVKDNKAIGSLFIGQLFTDPRYFWGRPSATSPVPYNGAHSSGSNMGPSNPAFIAEVKKRIYFLRQNATDTYALIPIALITASGSGLDPEISPEAAFYQAPRVAKARHWSEKDLRQIITQHIIKRSFGILGEPRVNVLKLNMTLDQIEVEHG